MNRRFFGKQVGGILAASLFANRALSQSMEHMQGVSAASTEIHSVVPSGPKQKIGMLMYPGMIGLDFVGPHAFLAGLMNVQVHLLWKTLDVIAADRGLRFLPDTTLEECPKDLDVLFVPGGTPGTVALMQDDVVLEFLADRGSRARFVTSVCTGSLVLGAAGLLRGYRATSHWAKRDLLSLLGATPVDSRVVEDRNRITGAGVTSGIDFGLLLAARMRSQEFAEMQQLMNEYDPHPPFHAGTPQQAGPVLTEHLSKLLAPGHEAVRQAALAAQKRLGIA